MKITTVDGRQHNRVSKWIHIEYRCITSKHSLYDYADDGVLICFRHDGKLHYLSGYDCNEWYKPYLCEIDDGGEYIRLYQEIN